MPRLPLTPQDITAPAELVAGFRARNRGQLLDVQRMMLHSPSLATAWNGFFSGIKSGMLLSPMLREMIACTVGIANGARYQYQQHAAPFLAGGGSQTQLEALLNPDQAAADRALFDATARAVLTMALEMTRSVKVSDQTFVTARLAMGSDQAMVEMVGVIAGYNLVSRFLVALEIEPSVQVLP